MEICQIEKITDCKHVNLFSIQYRDRAKNIKNWVFASRSQDPDPLKQERRTADAVVIVPFHRQAEKLVIIKEFRVALGGFQYGFPAGLVDQGETIVQAGERELLEETGLAITRVLKQSPPIYSSSGMTDETISLLFVECDGNPSNEFNEMSEEIEVIMLSQEAAKGLISKAGLKFDVKSWMVLSMFADYGIIS
ncbi:MAG: NUDIX hydrolase [Deltaproteobacteria bacterium]|nr:MAG: NUDIX hydrolase [Deltaproteobacteria bacterium]